MHMYRIFGFAACRVGSFPCNNIACQIAEKERDRKPTAKAEPVNTKAPTLDEKVRFTYDLYRTSKIDVSHATQKYLQIFALVVPRPSFGPICC